MPFLAFDKYQIYTYLTLSFKTKENSQRKQMIYDNKLHFKIDLFWYKNLIHCILLVREIIFYNYNYLHETLIRIKCMLYLLK